MSINKVILIGNIGQDPEIRRLESGMQVANFSLATSEIYKDKQGNKQTNTEWHNIQIWGSLADVVERYVKKGDKLYLEGKIKTSSWEDKEGNKKYKTDIICNIMQMLGNRTNNKSPESEESDDLPF